MQRDTPTAVDPIDPDALMADLRRRVAEKKARGLYQADALVSDVLDGASDPASDERLRASAVLRQSLEVPASTRPVVGAIIERIKGFVVRASFLNVQRVIDQQSQVNGDLIARIRLLGDELEALRAGGAAAGDDGAQDAALARRAALTDGAHTVASHAELTRLDAGAHEAIAVPAAALADLDAAALHAAMRDLAAVVPAGGSALVAPGDRDPSTLAALLVAVGFDAAEPERGDDAAGARGVIVVARR